MEEKRYAIVRVEDVCPSFESKELCKISKYCFECKIKKTYGDTKEQLIKKIAQVIKRELKGDCVAGLKDTVFVMKWCTVENLAEIIVEFLGVE